MLLGGLSSLPEDIYEAARIDGATAWQRFRHLTLPLLRPFINIALVLNIIYVFNSFPIIWVMTQGDPANSTDILVTYLYKLAFRYGRLDLAAALSLVMFADPARVHDRLCVAADAGRAAGGVTPQLRVCYDPASDRRSQVPEFWSTMWITRRWRCSRQAPQRTAARSRARPGMSWRSGLREPTVADNSARR